MYNILPDTFLLIFDNIDFISYCKKLSLTEMNVFGVLILFLKVTFLNKSYLWTARHHIRVHQKSILYFLYLGGHFSY